MGKPDSSRIQHDLEDMPNTFRNDDLEQIINDLNEEDAGKGFSEAFYVGATPFIDKIINWDAPAKNKKRSEVQFGYNPSPFIETIVKTIFDEDGTAVISTISATITYNANKTVETDDVTTARS